jgi:hypothetical protein
METPDSRTWLAVNWFKLTILILLFVGGYFIWETYSSSLQKQNEIAEQEAQLAQQKYDDEKAESDKKYIADRKTECYSLYEKERIKWNNVKDQEYDEEADQCIIWYKDNDAATKWAGKNCDDLILEFDSPLYDFGWRQYRSCSDGLFYNSF